MGLPQFIDGHPVRATLYGGLQLGLGAVSIGTLVRLSALNTDETPHPDGLTEEEMRKRTTLQRFAIQWPATFGFYGVWATSWADARGTWRRQQELRVGWSPTVDTPAQLTVRGRF